MERYREIICDKEYQKMLGTIGEYEKNRQFCCHTLEHFCDVARIMYILALEEGSMLEQDIIYTTALLHDIGRAWEYEKGIPHDQASVEFARELLARYHYYEEEIHAITRAIGNHRESSEDLEEDTLSYYLYQADKLSRNCFSCKARKQCKWSEEKMNTTLIL